MYWAELIKVLEHNYVPVCLACFHSIQEERDEDAIAMETGEEPGTGQEMAVVLHEVCLQ